jgi:hypothetical protein
MPLTSPADYVRLGEHLSAIDPVLTAWASEHEFARDFKCGRYPRRVYRRAGEVGAFLDIEMERDTSGDNFDHFFPEIPYSAVLGVHHGAQCAQMAGRRIALFRGLPFTRLVSELPLHLRACDTLLSKYTKDYLLAAKETFMMPILEFARDT